MWAASTVLQQVAAAVTGRCICLSRSMFTPPRFIPNMEFVDCFCVVNCNNQRVHWPWELQSIYICVFIYIYYSDYIRLLLGTFSLHFPWEFEGHLVHISRRQALKCPVLLHCFSGRDMSAFACLLSSSSSSCPLCFLRAAPPNKTFVAPGAVWNVQILLRWRGHMGGIEFDGWVCDMVNFTQ